ncbi:MAG: deoxyribonuclease V [Chloroflexi bacterium]|nr:deoxyribonuclease V [Chloroflexota bacterium]
MKVPQTQRWDWSPAEAIEQQRALADRVITRDVLGAAHYVAGVDVGFEGQGKRTCRAAIVVLKVETLKPVDYAVARRPVAFPYIPGLLAFREIPAVLRSLEQLKTTPDVFIVDGHGLAHPRRIGIASHLGVLLDWPTIGCAKSLLVGQAAEPENRVGAWTPLMQRGETIGAALRTRVNTKPVYVSIGHRVSLKRAIEVVLSCCKGFRLPETTRYAHRAAGGEKIQLDVNHGG